MVKKAHSSVEFKRFRCRQVAILALTWIAQRKLDKEQLAESIQPACTYPASPSAPPENTHEF